VNKKLESMSRKELLVLARVNDIKGRSKMKKAELIAAIKKARKPLKELRKVESDLKQEISKKIEKDHIELLPQEPRTVFVNWEITEKYSKEGVLKIIRQEDELLNIPVNLSHGKGYMRIEGSGEIKAVIGYNRGRRFKEIISSEAIILPSGKVSSDRTLKWANVDVEKGGYKVKKEKTKSSEELEKERERQEKEAKKIKYLHFPRQSD